MNVMRSEKIEATEAEPVDTNLAAVSEVEAGIRDFVRNDIAYLRRPVAGSTDAPLDASASVVPPTPIAVANLSQPVTLTLPSPASGNAPGIAPAITFWDAAKGAYSSAGVVTMPNPAPPGAALSWRANFSAASAADLPLAWAAAVPGCAELVLNCSDAWEATLAVSLDPQAALGAGVVRCGSNQTGLMRVFAGHTCPLWQPGAACAWNVSAQAFMGPSCVYARTTQAATVRARAFPPREVMDRTSAPQWLTPARSRFRGRRI